MFVDLHTHPVAHGESKFSRENLERYIIAAINHNCRELGFSDHDVYLPELDFGLVQELQRKYPQLKLLTGLEVDYRPESVAEIRKRFEPLDFDYLIGSVHEVSGWIFDDPDHLEGYQEWQGDDLYAAYFATVAEAARSGLFQIMGHPDVIRVFGFPCQSPLLELAMPALEAIAAADVAIEINTNGKYKPIGEYYPNIALLKAAYRLGIPITLGSDAHEPANVARDFQDAVNLLREVGYKSIVTFHQKQRLEYQIAL